MDDEGGRCVYNNSSTRLAMLLQVGLAIKPGTTVEELAPWANQIDMALVMTVEPGFGGQKFMEDMMPKVMSRRRKLTHNYSSTDLTQLDLTALAEASSLGPFDACHPPTLFPLSLSCNSYETYRTLVVVASCEHLRLFDSVVVLCGSPFIWRRKIDGKPESSMQPHFLLSGS